MGESERGLQIQLSTALRQRDEARDAIAAVKAKVLATELRPECLICHERPVVDAPDAAACAVCMLADLRRIMSERNAAESERDALRGELEAATATFEDEQAAHQETLEALAAARRECEQAESERDAASEVLRDALAWEAETRGRLGLPQIDAPQWAQIARAALGGGCALDENEQVKRLTAAMREADRLFEQVGGTTRHHVRDCLLPILEKHGLRLVAALAVPADGDSK